MLTKDHIPITYIFKNIEKETVFVSLYMLLTIYLDDVYKIDKSLNIPSIVIAVLGTNISLALSFKTNHSYQRWLTARSSWGKIKSFSIILVQQLQCFLSRNENNSEDLLKFSRRQIALSYIIESKLRKKQINQIISKYYDANESEYIIDSESSIPCLLKLQFEDIRKMVNDNKLDKSYQIEMQRILNSLYEDINVCFGIKSTVFPVLYNLYVKWMLYLFVIILPLALIDFNNYIEFFIVISISLLFFLMEKASSYLQDPFENLPTDVNALSIAREIEIEINKILELTDTPEPLSKEQFYIM
ncbi:MAG: bestrophin family ion channel [Candidatus Sericytochromatia bacterium]